MTARDDAAGGGFVDFYRRYAKTWVHAVAVAAMTALGTLTIVHRWFAALALAAYAVPPVALYVSRTTRVPGAPSTASDKPVESAGGVERDETEGRGGGTGASVSGAEETAWTTADTPVDAGLSDAAVTTAGGYAVGADGVVLADRGDGWTVVLEDGPGATSNALCGVDATADGTTIWIAGDGGALARVDAASGRHTDFTAPDGITDAWTDVAVGGESGDETLLLANGSGEVLRGRFRGGEVAWTPRKKPGGGSSIAGVDLVDKSTGYLCDSNDGAFATSDGGDTFGRIGVDGVDGTLTDVAGDDAGGCLASADDGVLHRFDGDRWTPERLGDRSLWAVARRGDYAVVCGDDGLIFEWADGVENWQRNATPTGHPLHGVAVGDGRAVAVDIDGLIVQRRLHQ